MNMTINLSEKTKKVLITLVGSIVIGTGYIYYNESNRKVHNFAGLEREIIQAEDKIKALRNLEPLPDVVDQWLIAKNIAHQYGAVLEALDPNQRQFSVDTSQVDGGHIWQGAIKGNPERVFMAAMEIQKTIPALLGDAVIDDKSAAILIGVIGSPPKKSNVYLK